MSLIIGIGTRIGRRVNKALNKWHTVVSQLQAMFLYRVAGGADNDDLPESNGRAVINAIYGNTVKWNQLLASGRLVDMGLPSGTLWATRNIDITQEDGFAASPFQYGCTMFSWGNIEGHNTPASGTTFDYNWGEINSEEPWFEGQPYGDTTGSTLTSSIVANDTQDAARYNLGSLFKMPTSAQFKELINNCDFVRADGTTVIDGSVTNKQVTVNGIVGIYLKSKVNGNLIFFSASGFGYRTSWSNYGSRGYYWSSSLDSFRDALSLYFVNAGVFPLRNFGRPNGFAVRAVVTPSTTGEIGHDNHKFCLTSNHKNMVDLTALEYPNIASTTPTVAEVEAWLALNVGTQDYYPHDEGSIISFKGTGIKSVGFNKWDGTYIENRRIDATNGTIASTTNINATDYIRVLANTNYYLNTTRFGSNIFGCAWYDADKHFISGKAYSGNPMNKVGVVLSPNNAAYLRASFRLEEITTFCINISDAAKNGTYEPYWSDEKPFDVTKVYGKLRGEGSLVQVFPDGMFEGLSDRLPEDYIEYSYGDMEAVAANKKIDLGDCAWSLVSGCSHTFETTIDITKAEAIGYTFSDEIDENDTTKDKLIGLVDGGSTKLALLDRSLSSTDLVSGHITALEGVDAVYYHYHPNIDYYLNLVYRDNGTDTPLEEIFPIKYKVDKYSTEELLVPTGDAPTSTSMIADIEYQAR